MLEQYYLPRLMRKVRKYRKAHPEVRHIVIIGTLGESSAKQAIATVLATRYRVRMHEGKPRDQLDTILGFFGIDKRPGPHDIRGWHHVMKAVRYQCRKPPLVDVIIQSLPVSFVGAIAGFGEVYRPHAAVITGISASHLQQFASMDELAKEVFSASDFSEYLLINRDDVDGRYAELEHTANFNTYGSAGSAEYRVLMTDLSQLTNIPAKLVAPELTAPVDVNVQLVGEHTVRPLAAAAALGFKMQLTLPQVVDGLSRVKPLHGRMNPLRGIGGTTVLDDSASIDPDSAVAALQTLYQFTAAPQRIAIFGSMYDLGNEVMAAHQVIGDACSVDQLAWVVTVGQPAGDYLTHAARDHGCQVRTFATSLEALTFVRSVTEDGAIILIKGGEQDDFGTMILNMIDVTEYSKTLYHDHRADETAVV